MRLLMSFAIIVGLAIAAENARPQCSMAGMTGVEWIQCLLNEFALVVVHPPACDSGREKNGHDVRGDHSQNHYAIYEQHLTPSNHTTSARCDGFRRT